MFVKLNNWLGDKFGRPEVALLFLVVIIGLVMIVFFGSILAPLLIGLVLAFLLESVVKVLTKFLKLSRGLAVLLSYTAFCGLFILAVFLLLPVLWSQFVQLAEHLPQMLAKVHQLLNDLPNKYPTVFSSSFISSLTSSTPESNNVLPELGKFIVSHSINSIQSIVTWVVYLVLVPLLTLFFLKDKVKVLNWVKSLLPKKRDLLNSVATEMQFQLGRYVQGKFIEVMIMWMITYIGFLCFGLKYSFLLSFAVGLSAIIPYIGMVLVTVPVFLIGFFQWGFEPHFFYMFLVYLIIQGLDGTVLVPLLFAGAVDLSPIAIIAAVLFFGGIWGFWGLFFSIPLATLVRAVGSAWYNYSDD